MSSAQDQEGRDLAIRIPVEASTLQDVLTVVDVAKFVLDYAASHGVRALRTRLDEFSEALTRLSGDEARLDDVGQT